MSLLRSSNDDDEFNFSIKLYFLRWCCFFRENSYVFFPCRISNTDNDQINEKASTEYALVLDGSTLAIILSDDAMKGLFLILYLLSFSVFG